MSANRGNVRCAIALASSSIDMTSIAVAVAIFGCLPGGAIAGVVLRGILPKHHLDPDTRDLIKLGVGLIGTMSALVAAVRTTA